MDRRFAALCTFVYSRAVSKNEVHEVHEELSDKLDFMGEQSWSLTEAAAPILWELHERGIIERVIWAPWVDMGAVERGTRMRSYGDRDASAKKDTESNREPKDEAEPQGSSSRAMSYIGDGKSQETAIFFTNARSHLQHILSQQEFIREKGIVGLRRSVQGDDRYFYDVWQTQEGEVWFKVPPDQDPSQMMREMEELLKKRQGSFAKFEARVRDLQQKDASANDKPKGKRE